MAFKSKELTVSLEIPGTNGWLFVVGCGPRSVKCDNTQPFLGTRPYERQDPIDLETGIKTQGDFDSLMHELRTRLGIPPTKAALPSKAKRVAKGRKGSMSKSKAGGTKTKASSSSKKVPKR